MKRKAKELQAQKREAQRSGRKMTGYGSGGFGSGSGMGRDSIIESTPVEPPKPSYTAPK